MGMYWMQNNNYGKCFDEQKSILCVSSSKTGRKVSDDFLSKKKRYL